MPDNPYVMMLKDENLKLLRRVVELEEQRDDLLAACQAFVTAYKKSLQLEKTDVALRMAEAAIAKARGDGETR